MAASEFYIVKACGPNINDHKNDLSFFFFLEKASLDWWWKYLKNISEGIPLSKSLLASISLQLR